MSKTSKWLIALALPFGIVGSWLAARVAAATMALGGVVTMVVAKQVLLALAAALGTALATSSAHAQGMSGFIYARDRAGADALVYRQTYQDLARFGNDLYWLGRAYDGGVRAVLYDERTQAFITYAVTAEPTQPGKDLVRATLDARNYNPNAPTIVEVFVAGFGGTMIGSLSGSMFAQAYGGGTYKSDGTIQQY